MLAHNTLHTQRNTLEMAITMTEAMTAITIYTSSSLVCCTTTGNTTCQSHIATKLSQAASVSKST